MKKLSLLMLAILILGCGTEKPVVEEPDVEEPPPAVMEPELSHHPLIADGTVKPGQVNVDPEPLNSRGFHFQFTEPFASYWVSLYTKTGEYLDWEATLAGDPDLRDSVWIRLISEDGYLEYDTEYKLVMLFKDFDCDSTDIVIQFRTKPRKPVVGRLAPVIQERPPIVSLGERFRLDIALPVIVDGDVADGEINVDPELLNAIGIRFEFNEDINRYKIDLRLHEGASLGWLPRDLVKNDMGRRIQIIPVEGAPLLEFDTEYEIDIFVEDRGCWTTEFQIHFRTMPKP